MNEEKEHSGSISTYEDYSSLIGLMTPLGGAIMNRNPEMVQVLVENPKTDINNTGAKEPAIFIALRLGKPEIAMILLTKSNDRRKLNATYIDEKSGDAALHLAARNGYADVVQKLLTCQAIDLSLKNAR